MRRAFCVMTFMQNYNPNDETVVGEYKNHRVLVGSQDSIDTIKTAIENKVAGSFEVEL